MSVRRVILGVSLLVLFTALLAVSSWYWLLHTQSGARWAWERANDAAGGALEAAELRGDFASGVILTGVTYDAAGVRVSIDTLGLAADVNLLPVVIAAKGVEARGTRIRLERSGDAETRTEPVNVRDVLQALQLPFELVVADLAVYDVHIEELVPDGRLVIDSASLAGRWKDAIEIERLTITLPGIDARAEGRMQLDDAVDIAVNVEVESQPEVTGLERPLTLTATARGPLDEIDIRASTDMPAVTLAGTLSNITADPSWRLEFEGPRLDLPNIGGLPGLPPLSIAASGEGDLRSFRAEAQVALTGTNMKAGFDAIVDIADSVVAGDVSWENARWPLAGEETRVSSRSGRVSVSGSLDEWQVDGVMNIKVPDLPAGQFTIDGGGNRQRASVDILDSNVLGGRITGAAEYSWRGQRDYSATLELANVQTAALLPEWPAELSGGVALEGQQIPAKIAVTLSNLRGSLRDKPLKANGRIDLEAGRVEFRKLTAEHGQSQARVDGRLYASSGLSFDLDIDELGEYHTDAAGSIVAAGVVSLDPERPLLKIDASSSAIALRNVRIEDLSIRDGNTGAQVFAAAVGASTISIGETVLERPAFEATVDKQSQTFDVFVARGELSAKASLKGTIDSWDEPSAWSGSIEALELSHADVAVRLTDPANVELARNRADIERLCLGDEDDIDVCVRGSWSVQNGIDAGVDVLSIPLNLVNSFADTRLDFDQVVSGELGWRQAPDARAAGRVELQLSPGTLASVDQPELTLATGAGTLSFDIDDDNVLSGVVGLPLNETGAIGGEFEILNIADGPEGNVSGDIDVDIADVGMFAAVLPVVDDAAGRLRADLVVTGNPRRPDIVGELGLDGGRVRYLPIGLELEDIDVEGTLLEGGEVVLDGSFRAGEGRATFVTRAEHIQTPNKGIEIKLRGRNLRLIDVPDIRANADANVEVRFDGKRLGIDGRVEIPHARIRPTDLGTRRIVESDDVNIVAGSLPDDEVATARGEPIELHGSLEVSLGKDVRVELQRAQAKLTGSTVFTWDGEPLPVAEGAYNLGGEIVAFGQRLDITEGVIGFSNVRADSPSLRIRAEREIFGNTEIRTAGVLVAGTAKNPTVEPYTIPLTTRERALTLLATGSDFNFERGVGAVDFGTYVAPRVYVSYGIGLFDELNVLRVRYDLGRGFGVAAASGQRDSGVDVTYRIER